MSKHQNFYLSRNNFWLLLESVGEVLIIIKVFNWNLIEIQLVISSFESIETIKDSFDVKFGIDDSCLEVCSFDINSFSFKHIVWYLYHLYFIEVGHHQDWMCVVKVGEVILDKSLNIFNMNTGRFQLKQILDPHNWWRIRLVYNVHFIIGCISCSWLIENVLGGISPELKFGWKNKNGLRLYIGVSARICTCIHGPRFGGGIYIRTILSTPGS